MNDSELPDAAVEAAARRVHEIQFRDPVNFWDVCTEGLREDSRTFARAVLVAATERIDCPKCEGNGCSPLAPETAKHRVPPSGLCSVCAGSGVLFVLKTEKP